MTAMTHITHIEFDGDRYYWWCQDADCQGPHPRSRRFVYEADCAADAGEHEREVSGG